MQSPVVLALILLIAACTSRYTSPTKFVPASTDATTLRTIQQLQMSYGGGNYEMIGVLETSLNHTSLAVLNANGLLLFSMTQTPIETTTTKHPDLPSHLDPVKVLEDVQLVNWPRNALLRAIGPKFDLVETPHSRVLIRGDVASKKVLYQPNAESWSHATLQDSLQNYTLDVRTLSRTFIEDKDL